MTQNVGFDLPLYCGFEFLSPAQPKQPKQELQKARPYQNSKTRVKHAGMELVQSEPDGLNKTELDDLNRLEDIY